MFVLPLSLMLGCPESPPDLQEGENIQVAGEPSQPGAPTGGAAGPAPGGSAGGGIAPEMDPGLEDPQFAQEDLVSDPDAISIAGTLLCEEGEGPYRVRVFVPPPEDGGPEKEGEDAGPPSPLVNVEVAEAGEFSFKAPASPLVVVLAYEDLDDNDLPTLEEPQFGPLQGNPISVSGDLSGVTLDCAKPLPVPGPRNAEDEPGLPDPSTVVPAPAPGEGVPPPEGSPVPGEVEGAPPADGEAPPPGEGPPPTE